MRPFVFAMPAGVDPPRQRSISARILVSASAVKVWKLVVAAGLANPPSVGRAITVSATPTRSADRTILFLFIIALHEGDASKHSRYFTHSDWSGNRLYFSLLACFALSLVRHEAHAR